MKFTSAVPPTFRTITATTMPSPSDMATTLISRKKHAESSNEPMIKYFKRLILRKNSLILDLLFCVACRIVHQVVLNKAMLIKHPMARLVVNTKDIYDNEPAIIINDNRTDVLITRSGKFSSKKEDGALSFIGIISINY